MKGININQKFIWLIWSAGIVTGILLATVPAKAQVYVKTNLFIVEAGTIVGIGEQAVGADFIVSGMGAVTNDGSITLMDGASLQENSNQSGLGILKGSGGIQLNMNLNAPSSVNVGGLGLIISSSANLGNTSIVRSHSVYDVGGSESIYRSYQITPTNNSGLDATVSFTYDETELNGYSEEDLELASKNPGWTTLSSSVNTSTNRVTYSGINSMDILSVQSNLAPLPIELVNFTASASLSKVYLDWETSTEINNDYFTVERSLNGLNFDALDEILGAGNSTQPLSYDYVDYNAPSGLLYYRLKQTDFDGTYSYSDVVAVESMLHNINVEVFPNPTADYAVIRLNREVMFSGLQMINTSGQSVEVSHEITESGIVLDVQNIKNGLYTIVLEDINATVRLIVSR